MGSTLLNTQSSLILKLTTNASLSVKLIHGHYFYIDEYLFRVSAVLITGSGGPAGNGAELYVPSSGISCRLPSLPNYRTGHTSDSNGVLCGGSESDSCVQWNLETRSWEEYLALDVDRVHHVSWTPDPEIGTYLIGGFKESTTTIIKPDKSLEAGFIIKHDYPAELSMK